MNELFDTYGIDLRKVADEARANEREDVALAIEKKIAEFQSVYEFFGARYSSCPDEPLWKVDAEEIGNW